MNTQPARRSLFSRLPSTLLAAAAMTALSLLLLGYEAVGAHRLGLFDLQDLWRNDDNLLTSAVGWHVLVGSFDRGLQALLPGASFLPGLVILTLVCWLAWGYAALFIFRQASHAQLGRDSLAWLGVLFILPAAAIMVPLLYVQWVPDGQATGEAGFLGVIADLVAVSLVMFLAAILLLPRRIALGVIAGQALTWGLIYAVVMWGFKAIGVPALGPLFMLVLVLFLLCLFFMFALQRATDGLASLTDLGEGQALEYGLMILAGLAASRDKVSPAELATAARVPVAETEELLRRFKDASLARLTQGRWAGVWPPERTQVEAVAGALGLSGKVAATAATPLVGEAHNLGWQGVSLADLTSMPDEAVRKAPQEPHTLEAIDAQSAEAMPLAPRPVSATVGQASAAIAAAPNPRSAPEATQEPQSEPQPEAQPEEVQPEQASSPAQEAHAPGSYTSGGHRMVRSPEASAPPQATPQTRALHLALGRPASAGQQAGILGAGDYDVMVSGHSPWQAGQSQPQAASADGIVGAQDYAAMTSGGSPWRDTQGEGEGEAEAHDDSVTLDAIRREIQALMDEES